MTETVRALVEEWLALAETCRRLGATGQAATLEACAEQLAAVLQRCEEASVTIQQAAEESGYSTSQLHRLLRNGTIDDVGEDGKPMIRRGDMPRKPGRATVRTRLDATVRQLRAS